jgi:hypothetical protein
MWKYPGAWFAMLLVSVANGALRELAYGRYMSELAAHQVSTLVDILLLGIVMRAFARLYPPASGRQALAIGLLWMALTVAFEFLFFHYLGGHSWAELRANYDLLNGRVWVLVLIWIALGPYLLFRLGRKRDIAPA